MIDTSFGSKKVSFFNTSNRSFLFFSQTNLFEYSFESENKKYSISFLKIFLKSSLYYTLFSVSLVLDINSFNRFNAPLII
jgi:hypothetical protein